jgi:hypothetical protein
MPRAVSPSSLVSFFTFYDYMTEFTGRAQVKWRSPLVEKRCFWHVALAWNTVLKSLRTLPPAAPTPTFPTNRSKRPSTRTTFQHSREDSATPEKMARSITKKNKDHRRSAGDEEGEGIMHVNQEAIVGGARDGRGGSWSCVLCGAMVAVRYSLLLSVKTTWKPVTTRAASPSSRRSSRRSIPPSE